jgi:hypothetical protein
MNNLDHIGRGQTSLVGVHWSGSDLVSSYFLAIRVLDRFNSGHGTTIARSISRCDLPFDGPGQRPAEDRSR